jgi:hypothetical protein
MAELSDFMFAHELDIQITFSPSEPTPEIDSHVVLTDEEDGEIA